MEFEKRLPRKDGAWEHRSQYAHQSGENTGFILLLQIRSMRRDAISPPGKKTGLYDGAIPVLWGAA